MSKYLVVLLSFFSTAAFSNDYHIMDLNKAFVDYYKNNDIHDPYLEPADSTLTTGASFNTNFDVFKYEGYGLYWDNNLHFDQDTTGQVRAAGWQYSLNLVFFQVDGKSKLELFRQHHSQHILDRSRPEHFPVYDRTGIRVILYDRSN